MKALTIPASRVSISGCMRSAINLAGASVSNLRGRIDARASLSVAAVATVALFACLGAMYIPGIIASGLSALMAVIIAPMGDIDAKVDREGGAA